VWANATSESIPICNSPAVSCRAPRVRLPLVEGAAGVRLLLLLPRSDHAADRANARSTRSRITPGRYRSAHSQRTICHPRSRSASSRRFSSKSTSSIDCLGLSSRPYLIFPSNSPMVRCSFQRKSTLATNVPRREYVRWVAPAHRRRGGPEPKCRHAAFSPSRGRQNPDQRVSS
jgi:hypothetical protein